MHMQTQYGYRLAIRRTDKSVRFAHRSAARFTTVHDASYLTCIALKATNERDIAAVLSKMGDHNGTKIHCQN